MIGCGDRCSGAAYESLLAGPFVKLAAIATSSIFPSKAACALKKKLPEQVIVDSDDCFAGFDGYQKVIDSRRGAHRLRLEVPPHVCRGGNQGRQARVRGKAAWHRLAGCNRMQAACDLARQKNLSLLSGLHSRYHDGYRQTVEQIHNGAIGDVVAIQAMFLRGPSRHQTQAEHQRDAVSVQQLVSFLLAFRRRRAPVAGAQHGPRRLDP